jgi:hypothetical protein
MSEYIAEGFRHGKETTGEGFVTVQPTFSMRGEDGAFAVGKFFMSPAEARALSVQLIAAADYCETTQTTDATKE